MLSPAQLLLIERLIQAFLGIMRVLDLPEAAAYPVRARITRALVSRLLARLEHLRDTHQPAEAAAAEPPAAAARTSRARRRRTAPRTMTPRHPERTVTTRLARRVILSPRHPRETSRAC